MASRSKALAIKFLIKILSTIIFASIIISILAFIFAPEIVKILLGNSYLKSIVILRIFAFIPFFLSLSSIFANLFMLGFGYTKEWSLLILPVTILSILGGIVLVYFLKLSYVGMAINMLSTEIILCIFSLTFFIMFKKHNK